jgi:DNA processing protein
VSTGEPHSSVLEVETIHRADPDYPERLAQLGRPPAALHVAGGAGRLRELLEAGAVAIVGTRRPSDYGMETARGLARELAASGVTVIGAMADGIAAAAHMGALEARGARTVTVMPGGLDICLPASRRALYERVRTQGCAVSELPCGARPHRFSELTRRRIVAGMADLVIVVEAEERASALREARTAQELGRTVAAVPGRVSSPVSRGPHALLAEGARLVRDAQDALDALYGVGARRAPEDELPLEPLERRVLEEVGVGRDTLGKLAATGVEAQSAIVALAELELVGAVVRGDGGRYLPRG